MTDANEGSDVSRRDYIKVAGASTIGVTGLAGCMGGGGDGDSTTTDSGSDETTESSDGDTTTEEQSSDYETLEVQHWWTGGDGAAAVEALFEGFAEAYPDIEVNQNPVSGGAGQNLETVIKKRVLNNNPPSSWQAWPGANLQPYTEADKLEDIGDSVWSENDMKNAYLEGPKEAARPGGNFVTVPLNIHRINNLFYNVSVVEEAGIDPSTIETPSDLVDALETVESETDAVGMAHQTQSAWSTTQLWATVLLGETDVETYNSFTEGNVADNEEAVKSALQTVADYTDYLNEDAGSVGW